MNICTKVPITRSFTGYNFVRFILFLCLFYIFLILKYQVWNITCIYKPVPLPGTFIVLVQNACKSLEANFMIDLQHTFESILELTLSFC